MESNISLHTRYIIDTSFILALFIEADSCHDQAVDIFSHIPRGSIFYMGEPTYMELLTVAHYKLGVSGRKSIQSFLGDIETTFLQSGTQSYIQFFEYIDKRISVVDASIIYDSLRYHLDILSFDMELIKIHKHIKNTGSYK